jgi:hypothetical protein
MMETGAPREIPDLHARGWTSVACVSATLAGAVLTAFPGSARAQTKPADDAGDIVPALPRPRPATTAAPAATSDLGEIVPPLPRPRRPPAVAPVSGPPPPPVEESPGARKKEEGRISEIVWADAEVGFGYVNLASLQDTHLEALQSAAAGGMYGFGAGVRITNVTIGGQARLSDTTDFEFWELDGQLGVHIPLQKWDPFFAFHGGYAVASALSPAVTTSSQLFIHGGNLGLDLGGDYYVLPYVSLGAGLAGDLLFLERAPFALPASFKDLPPAEQKTIRDSPSYKDSGQSIGVGISASLHVGVHI